MGRPLTEDNAISLMTTGLDFAVTQVGAPCNNGCAPNVYGFFGGAGAGF